MKTKVIFGLLVLAMVVGISSTQAQRPGRFNRQGCLLGGDVNQEQLDKIDAFRTAFYQDTKDDHNKLNELMARKRTLETTDPADQKALNECLASINNVKTDIEKKRVRHFQDIKSVLTDEQAVLFDARKKGRMNGFYQGFGRMRGNMNGYGRGNGQGLGRGQRGCGVCYGYAQGQRGLGNRQGYNRGNRPGRGVGQGYGRNQGRGYGRGMGYNRGQGCVALGLTDVQKEFVQQARIEKIQKEQSLKNKLNELNAQIRTATTGKNIDLNKVDKLISQKAELNLQMAQLRADHRVEVRGQLTEEQKAAWGNKPYRGRRGAYCRF